LGPFGTVRWLAFQPSLCVVRAKSVCNAASFAGCCPNFKQNDLLIHALVLHFAHSSMPESVHPAVWDSKLLADRTKHIPLDITDLPWIAELCNDGYVVQLVRQAVKDLKRGPGKLPQTSDRQYRSHANRRDKAPFRIFSLACRIECWDHTGKEGNSRQVSGSSDASKTQSRLIGS
jgi:hypothetical protein